MGTILLLYPSQGLMGRYYANTNWQGEPMLIRIDPQIQFSDTTPIKQDFFKQDYFSIAWEGFINLPEEGEYTWSTRSDDGSWLYIDGKLVVNNGGTHGFQEVEGSWFLSKGLHSVKLLYFEGVQRAGIKWYWKPSGKEKKLVPAQILFPYKPSSISLLFIRFLPLLRAGVLSIWVGTSIYLDYLLYRKDRLAGKNLKFILHRMVPVGFLLASLVFYMGHILEKNSVSILPADPYGYLQMGELMAKKGLLNTMLYDPLIPELYNAYHNRPEDQALVHFFGPNTYYVYDFQQGVLYNQYPPGFPALLALFIRIGGRDAAFYTLPVLNALFLLFMFGYFFIKYDGLMGLLITNHLASFTLTCYLTVLPMSDIPSMIFMTSSVLILYLTLHKSHHWLSFISGALFGFSLTIRYTNALIMIPILYLFLIKHKNQQRVLADLVLFALGGLGFGVVPLMVYLYHLFGHPFHNTYVDRDMNVFFLENWRAGASFYLQFLSKFLDPFQKVLMVWGLIYGLLNRKLRDLTFTCLLVFVVVFGFYIFVGYRFDRYLLPTFPFLFIFMGLAGYSLLQFSRRNRYLTWISTLLVLILALYPLLQLKHFQGGANWYYRMLAGRVKQITEDNAVIFCDDVSGPIKLYAERRTFKIGWLFTDRREDILEQTVQYLAQNNYPVYIVLDTLLVKLMFQTLEKKFLFERINIPGLKVPVYKLKT